MFTLVSIDEALEEEENPNDELNCLDSVVGEHYNLFNSVSKKDVDGVRRTLLEGSDVNAHSKPMGITALHIACAQGDEATVGVLIRAGAEPKAADKLGRTPLHMAATVGSAECVALLLRAGASPNVAYHVNSLPGKRHGELLMANKKGMIPLETLGLNLPFPDCWERTPLHQSVKANSPICSRLLLEGGAYVDPQDECGITPILLAGEGVQAKENEELEDYEDVVDILLSYGANVDIINTGTGFTPLHQAVSLYSERSTNALLKKGAKPLKASEAGGFSTAIHLAAELAASNVLDAILKSARDDYNRQVYTNVENDRGLTPLHMAVYAGCHTCVSLLIDAGADLGSVTHSGISALDALFLYLPRPAQFLARVFDSRIRPNAATVEERSFALQLDFRVLAPHGNFRQTGVMKALLEAESANDDMRRMLLVHPIVEAFIELKWRRLRLFFYLLVFVYVSFALSLSVYVTLIHSDLANSTEVVLSENFGREPSDMDEPNNVVLQAIIVSRRVLMCSSTIVLLNVLGQCVTLPRYYLRQFELWVNLITGVLALVVACESNCDGIPGCNVDFTFDSEDFSLGTRIAETDHYFSPIILILTAISILLAWAELMLLIGRFPTWGSQGLLFYAVLKNVFKVLLAFGCLVLGFAFSFFVQFHKSQPGAFGNPMKAVVKTIVMMMGEFEYLDLFEEVDNAPWSLQMAVSRIIFVCFVVLASIVLVNLMVGLAVSDTQALRSEGKARRLLKQAEFVSHLERGVSAVIRTHWLPQRILLHLSKRRAIDTIVVVRPSDAATAPAHRAGRHLPRRLLEDLVSIALRTREGERKRPMTLHFDGLLSNLLNSDNGIYSQETTVVNVLQNISRSLTDIKEMLEPRFGAPSNPSPSLLKVRKWSSARTPRARFSDLVSEVSGAQQILNRLSRQQNSSKNSPV